MSISALRKPTVFLICVLFCIASSVSATVYMQDEAVYEVSDEEYSV